MAPLLDEFLHPLGIDIPQIHSLARSLCVTYTSLAAESQEQFLPTPISEEVLRPKREGRGKFLAIDIGGTNLRVGFIELLGSDEANSPPQVSNIESQNHVPPSTSSRVLRHKHLEKAWPIEEHLKQEKAENLFTWIGRRIAEVVKDGCDTWPDEFTEIPLGVSFSFPMIQESLSQAKIMAMGKGFAITSNSNLGDHLLAGYALARFDLPTLPPIRIVAITNDAVATLISFTYQHRNSYQRKAAMGLIAGTGSNATIPLSISKLHPSKRPTTSLSLDTKITINTEWTISGAAKPLHDLGLFTKWDALLDSECEAPGFQPFEYMTSGRYLGGLGRIIIHDYLTNCLSIPSSTLPEKLRHRHGLTTSFLGNLGPHQAALEGAEVNMVKQLENELPSTNTQFVWTKELADVVFKVAKAVQIRAAGMTAAAIIGLLGCAGELDLSLSSLSHSSSITNGVPIPSTHSSTTPLTNGITKLSHIHNHNHPSPNNTPNLELQELMVGYTGGCIVHFQDYLSDCQSFLDQIMAKEFGSKTEVPRVTLMPCHDGGILGAGILAGTVMGMEIDKEKEVS